jgi:hypothetical protein
LNKLILATCFGLGVYFVTVVNGLAVKGFELNGLKKEIAALREENGRFEAQAMDRSSLDRVALRAQELDMVAVGQISYVQADASMAMR